MKECPVCAQCYEDNFNTCPQDGQKLNFSWPGTRTILGKYVIDSVLGKGGMGVVYRATQVELKRQVAVKVVSPLFLTNVEASRRFRTEALAAARLDHPNIIKIYDYGTLPGDGGAYLIMKLLRGPTLTTEMAAYGKLPFVHIVEIVRQICDAMDTAHHNHVVHCDLKPDNIILERGENNQDLVQLVDFGIARLRDLSGTGSLYSMHTGGAVGTPSYMSPEQCLGEKLYAQSDIYSLGVILYEMLAGTVPFKSQSAADVALHHIRTVPLPPSRFRAGISHALDEVVLKALRKLPQDRFDCANDLYNGLAAAMYESEDTEVPQVKIAVSTRNNTEDLGSNIAQSGFKEDPAGSASARTTRSTRPKSSKTSPLTELPFKPAEPSQSKTAFNDLSVLIVDDEQGMLDVLNTILKRFGCKVLMAYDGEGAWQQLKANRPNLIISDIMMPNVDGWQFFFRCKTDPSSADIPFIFITSHSIPEEKVTALEQGVEDYWVKPFVIPEVTVRIKRLLQRISVKR